MPPATSGTASTERMDSSPSHARPAAGEAGTAASAGGRRVVSHSARRPKGRWASVRAVEPRAKPSAACRSSSLPSRPSSQMAAAVGRYPGLRVGRETAHDELEVEEVRAHAAAQTIAG